MREGLHHTAAATLRWRSIWILIFTKRPPYGRNLMVQNNIEKNKWSVNVFDDEVADRRGYVAYERVSGVFAILNQTENEGDD